MCKDTLQFLPINRWQKLKDALKFDWPRSIGGYKTLETQEYMLSAGVDYGFKVYCPFGHVQNGMVALNIKGTSYEIVIECPGHTEKLEEALITTKLIDWNQHVNVPFAQKHITDCIKSVMERKNLKIDNIVTTETLTLTTNSLFDVELPPGHTFELLPARYAGLVDSIYPHRYPGSKWLFELLSEAKLGYGLFKKQELVAWVYIRETGVLGHLYTLEEHRRKGYGEITLKLISNIMINHAKTIVAYVVVGNTGARKLYEKLGFSGSPDVDWICLSHKE